jgi:hypothetical protein
LAAGLTALAAIVAGAAVYALGNDDGPKPALGLMTTVPIYWRESPSIGDMLDANAPKSWVRVQLERSYALVPLDTLDRAGGLDRLDRLLLAQPRALSPAENVALDGWVRSGGRLLLFADPMLTAETSYAIGDRRRPQDVVLLSPILTRWGLSLSYDEDQPRGERMVAGALPVDLAGRLATLPTAPDAPARCSLESGRVVADCRIGQGRVVVVADAALLDPARDPATGEEPLERLAERAFGR